MHLLNNFDSHYFDIPKSLLHRFHLTSIAAHPAFCYTCLIFGVFFIMSMLIFHTFLFYVQKNHAHPSFCYTCLIVGVFFIVIHYFPLVSAPLVIHYWPFQGSGSDVVLFCLFLVSKFRWCLTLCLFIIILVRFG